MDGGTSTMDRRPATTSTKRSASELVSYCEFGTVRHCRRATRFGTASGSGGGAVADVRVAETEAEGVAVGPDKGRARDAVGLSVGAGELVREAVENTQTPPPPSLPPADGSELYRLQSATALCTRLMASNHCSAVFCKATRAFWKMFFALYT